MPPSSSLIRTATSSLQRATPAAKHIRPSQCVPTLRQTRRNLSCQAAAARLPANSIPTVSRRPRALELPYLTNQSKSPPHTLNLSRHASSSSTASPKNFTYALAASYCGKANTFNPTHQHFTYNPNTCRRSRSGTPIAEVLPNAARLTSGQDAVFISRVGDSASCAFGVADGVGGWQDQGIDSAAFAHGLCMYMEEGAKYHTSSSSEGLDPGALLKQGYDRVCNDRSITGGGSTACLGVAGADGTLKVANLGDSGFMLLRLRRVHHYSDPQTHAFNTPYQLSRIPPKMLSQMQEFGQGEPFGDMPDDASITTHTLEHGDVLVFATDGVWDNLSSQDMLAIVATRMEKSGVWVDSKDGAPDVSDKLGEMLQEEEGDSKSSLQTMLATDIVSVAKAYGLDRRRDGPFAKEFQKVYPEEKYRGGKPDDIAVVVAIAVDTGAASASGDQHGGSKL